jgi:hypothetical protein
MRGVALRAVRDVLLVSATAGLIVLLTDGLESVLLESAVLAVAAVLLLALVRTIGLRNRAPVPSAFDSALAAMRRRPANAAAAPLVHDLRLSRLSAFHLHVRLRPLLSEIAAHRLWTKYGVDLAAEPVRAHELVGPAAWEVVRPDRAAPADRLARGPATAELVKIVTELERL